MAIEEREVERCLYPDFFGVLSWCWSAIDTADMAVLRRTRDAQAALDARNARYKTVAARLAQRNQKEGVDTEARELSVRLGAAEKAVEKFVANRLQPAVQKV